MFARRPWDWEHTTGFRLTVLEFPAYIRLLGSFVVKGGIGILDLSFGARAHQQSRETESERREIQLLFFS